MIRLWGFRYSTNADRIVLALVHKGIAWEEVRVDPADRSRMQALTGQPLVPALEHEGEIVWDSPRILDYLDTHFPDRPLYPADPAGRAQTRVFAEWFNRVWKVAPNALADEGRDAALSDRLRADQDVFEGLLSDGREYLVGEFGMADVVAWPFLRYAVDDDPADDERFHEVLRAHLDVDGRPSLAAWIDRMAARFAARWRFDPL